MKRTRVLGAFLAMALVAGACGDGEDAAELVTPPAASPSEGEGMPSEQPAPTVVADDVLLKLEDLPAGWTVDVADEEGKADEDCSFDEVAAEVADIEPASEANAMYENEGGAVGHFVFVFESPDVAARAGKAFTEALSTCSFAEDGMAMAFAPQSFDTYGDETWALAMDVSGEVDGFDMSEMVHGDVVVFRAGSVVSAYLQIDAFMTDTTLRDTHLTLIEARMRGEAMSSDEALEQVWGSGAWAKEGVLDQEEEAPATPPADSPGTRAKPLPLGAPAPVGDYTVVVTDVTDDATDLIAAANQFNSPPDDGHVFMLVTLDVLYHGTSTGTPGMDLSVGYVGSDNRVYDDTNCSEAFDGDMLSEPELLAGGAAKGAFCVQVPAKVVGTGSVFVKTLWSFDDTSVWWATAA